MHQNRKISNYAKAIFDLSNKNHSLDDTIKRLSLLTTINKSSDFRFFLHSKRISSNNKISIIKKIFVDILSSLEIDLLVQLIYDDVIDLLDPIIEHYKIICNNNSEVIRVTITTMDQINSNEQTELLNTIEKKLNKKVELTNHSDPTILGGIKFRIENKIIDGSIATRLDKLRKSLNER